MPTERLVANVLHLYVPRFHRTFQVGKVRENALTRIPSDFLRVFDHRVGFLVLSFVRL